jgi:hypothetical protein
MNKQIYQSLTEPQRKIYNRFAEGQRIHYRVVSGHNTNREVTEYRWPDGSLCAYRPFWNLMYKIYPPMGSIPPAEKNLYFKMTEEGTVVKLKY